MKGYLTYLFSVFALMLLNCKQSDYQDESIRVDPAQFKSFITNDFVQLIDIRTPKEFAQEHLHNAINIDFFSEEFTEAINTLDKQKPVYIYCRSGKRSSKSSILFKEAGFDTIYNLNGGLLKWKSQELPIIVEK
ncbi:rhodanese-like domain-containing protein [Tamlana sp. 2201CG12-4]|uniref:rhodanese-like domain-containing protein n=1 Tax=Tamlana sp. 2201CG12-4 TaxID=3112582 RepID=UPI002DBA3CB1|nr:rhodanese-like domain-containing protein [Tamlana sp. 2201CG12-4]MEC3907160.1 rhodanese-like domain-containing protein [Tamlana sp. 2201CG12-4]